METANARTVTYQTRPQNNRQFDDDDRITQQRLEFLTAANAETERRKSLYTNERDALEAATMKNPLTDRQAFAYFGLLLGIFPPAAIFTNILLEKTAIRHDEIWIIGVLAIVNLITAVCGFFSGKLIGKIIDDLGRISWTKMLLTLPVLGILWGILTGGAGGIIVFVIGAIFGGAIAAFVGAIAFPAFAILHRLLKKEDRIARKHFLPAAFGTTLIVSAFILGL